MKIFLCSMPKYIVSEQYENENFPFWREFFEDTLNRIREKYPFTYLNYKDDKEISGNRQYFSDLIHLSYEGSIVFTQKLAEEIQKHLKPL